MSTRVIDHGTWTETIVDLPDGGRVTYGGRKDPEPVPAVRLPYHAGPGTGLVRIMEADAVTDQASEDIATEWDLLWGGGRLS
jgi:hypothetical protein